MNLPHYTFREVVSLLDKGMAGVKELLNNRARLRDSQLLLMMALAAEYIGGHSE